MPKCTINGQEVEVKEGTSIIEAFKSLDQEICHYCWHPGLSVAGVCRLCMVEIEGIPKLQIACNTPVKDGMVVSNQSEKVKEAVRWGLDFHLINHPLDCPICDQAGECGLQEQYMAFGKYDPEMAEAKVKKRKVVDLGSKIVLDTERCILCSRCVRFTDEVSKTHELGIFNRGDRSEIGTFKDKPLENDYALNTVDICPVGALTSKDFRFRQRVWYLKEAETICPGCSTGCRVKTYHNEEGLWRVRPVYDEQVNGHWMCDKGRDVYKFVNRKARLTQALVGSKGQLTSLSTEKAVAKIKKRLDDVVSSSGPESVGIVVTGQYTNEEYQAFFSEMVTRRKITNVFHWLNQPESVDEFDGHLLRGDKNPNTKGLLNAMKSFQLTKTWADLEKMIQSSALEMVIVLGPENQSVFPDLQEKINFLSGVSELVWMQAGRNEALENLNCHTSLVPLKTYIEKTGTFTNYAGLERPFQMGTTIVPGALTLEEVSQLMAGQNFNWDHRPQAQNHKKTNFFTSVRGAL